MSAAADRPADDRSAADAARESEPGADGAPGAAPEAAPATTPEAAPAVTAGVAPDPAPAATLGRTLVPALLVALAAPALFVLLVPWLGWLLLAAGVASVRAAHELEAGAGELAGRGIREEGPRERRTDARQVALVAEEQVERLVARLELGLEAVQ